MDDDLDPRRYSSMLAMVTSINSASDTNSVVGDEGVGVERTRRGAENEGGMRTAWCEASCVQQSLARRVQRTGAHAHDPLVEMPHRVVVASKRDRRITR